MTTNHIQRLILVSPCLHYSSMLLQNHCSAADMSYFVMTLTSHLTFNIQGWGKTIINIFFWITMGVLKSVLGSLLLHLSSRFYLLICVLLNTEWHHWCYHSSAWGTNQRLHSIEERVTGKLTPGTKSHILTPTDFFCFEAKIFVLLWRHRPYDLTLSPVPWSAWFVDGHPDFEYDWRVTRYILWLDVRSWKESLGQIICNSL